MTVVNDTSPDVATGTSGNGTSGNGTSTVHRPFYTMRQRILRGYGPVAAKLRGTNADNVRTIPAMAKYFNSHFNFFGRKIAIKTYTGQGSLSNELQGNGQAAAQADAVTVGKQTNAFADISVLSDPYATALQHQGVMGFGDPYMPGYWHQNHAPYDWSLATDGTDLATDVANYAVQKLCPPGTPAKLAGGN